MQFKLLILMTISAITFSKCSTEIKQYQSIINMKKYFHPIDSPQNFSDSAQNLFMDEGAWFGFALPETNLQISGFVGPYLMQYKYGGWLSTSLINIKPVIKSENLSIDIESSMAYFDAGKLHLNIKYNNGINIDQSLQYISAKSVLINVSLHADSEIETELQWFGELLIDEAKYENIAEGFQFSLDNGLLIHARFSDPKIEFNLSESGYKSISTDPIKIGNQPILKQVILSIFSEEDDIESEIELVQSVLDDPTTVLINHKNRWERYDLSISKFNTETPQIDQKSQQSIAVKSLLTMINNWKSSYGELKHEGLFPSYARGYFRGFWAWDSWKHAVALAHFEPEVAKNQVRAMYDFQNEAGMIADCVFPDTTIESHNWQCYTPKS